jgi:C4-dicarboxylate-specific signal transduction histidine kinase
MRGVVMDITAQRDSELELQRVRSQLAHAGRVSMMGQLASALAHELNQPLGAILRNAEAAQIFLQDETPDIEELRAIIGDICKDDQRAGEVINRLRSMLTRRDLESRPIAVSDLLVEATTLARADAATRRVTLEISAPSDLPHVKGDRVHLQQVLLNLLLNAMDAMSDNSVGIRRVLLSASRDGADKIEVSVSDTGHGISPEKLPHVFDPFFTTKPHGMGIGLAISHTIIAAHGGQLSAENNAGGRGATFRFTLPVAEKGSAS